MNAHARRALALAAPLVAGVLTFSPDAAACAGPLAFICRGTTVVARPTDPPTIELRAAAADVEQSTFTLVYSTTPPTVTITDKDGANVDFGIAAHPSGSGRWVITPTTPLVTGARYKVAWETQCTNEHTAGEPQTTGEAEITAPKPASPPTALGTITVKGPLKRDHVSSSCDGVSYQGDEVVAQVTLGPDLSFAPWSESSGVSMLVDGKPLPPSPRWGQTWSDDYGWLRASCTSADATGITPAVHEITFTATVPGSATPLTAKTTIDFSCATAPTTLDPNAGSSSSGTSGSSAPSSSGSSCALGGSATSTLSAPALLLLAASLAFARRRR